METARRPGRRERFPGMSWPRTTFYRLCQAICRAFFRTFYHARIIHADRVPRAGGLLVVSNHQSHYDPPLIGSFLPRSLSYLARDSLFRLPGFGWLIRTLGAHPIKRGTGDTGAMKRAIELLDAGHAVLVFPEGTRTPDGSIKPFKRGTAVLIKRANCRVLPVAVEGTYNAWPKGDRPHFHARHVVAAYGEPIDAEELMAEGPDKALEFLALEIDALRLEGRAVLWNRTNGEYPPPGFADDPLDIDAWRAGTSGYARDRG